MKKQSGMLIFIMAAVFICVGSFTAFGASRKAITSVTFTVEAKIEPYTDYGDEEIEISSNSSKFSVSGYDILNNGFQWEADTVPKLRVTLSAEENYYFKKLGKDKVTIKGGTFDSASREDSNSTFLVDVTLPSLSASVSDIPSVTLTQDGFVYWDAAVNAGSYEIKVFREGKAVGSALTSETACANCRAKMVKGNCSYVVKVRPVNAHDPENKGRWTESNVIYMTQEQALVFREYPDGMPGEWRQEAEGRSWYLYSDGTYPADGRACINGSWYFFDGSGYMRTGWLEIGGKYYYCDEAGKLLMNAQTPDGYEVGSDGVCLNWGEEDDDSMAKEWASMNEEDDEEDDDIDYGKVKSTASSDEYDDDYDE